MELKTRNTEGEEDSDAGLLSFDGAFPPQGTQLFLLNETGFLFSEANQSLHCLNTAATLVWYWIEDGLELGEIVARLAGTLHVTLPEGRAFLEDLFVQWQSLGLLEPDRLESPAFSSNETQTVSPACAEDIPIPTEWSPSTQRCYRLLSTTICLRCESAEQMEWIHPVFAHLEHTAGSEGQLLVDVVAGKNSEHYIYADRKPYARARSHARLAPLVKTLICNQALCNYEHFAHFHAGGVGNGHSGIMMPGGSGSGKSSLTAALCRSGMQYFSDEVALLKDRTYQMVPVPLGICVKQPGWDLVGRWYPELSQLNAHRRGDEKTVRYIPPPLPEPPIPEDGLPVSHMVFPRYHPGTKTELKPISTDQALNNLLKNCFRVSGRLTVERVGGLIGWIKGVECYDLPMSRLDHAVALIQGLNTCARSSRTFDRTD